MTDDYEAGGRNPYWGGLYNRATRRVRGLDSGVDLAEN